MKDFEEKDYNFFIETNLRFTTNFSDNVKLENDDNEEI